LTYLIREAHLRKPQRRVGTYAFGPGEEMQHDTSPHRLVLGGKEILAQCAALVLTFSRMVYVQYYPRFTRFEAKWFLTEAFNFFSGVCDRCVVDNTSVLLASGSGSNAIFAPEIVNFGECYAMSFLAHEIGHSDRKPNVERGFSYAEGNFIPGRVFESWEDLNQQALNWCVEVANAKPKRSLGMSPQAAFMLEKDYLKSLPIHQPPIYKSEPRIVDTYGYVHLDTNRYSVPERLVGKRVEVQKHPRATVVYFRDDKVAEHVRALSKNVHVTQPGHHRPPAGRQAKQSCCEEVALTGCHEALDRFIAELKRRSRGRGVRQFQRLQNLKRTYPSEAFFAAIEHALGFGLFDLTRLENLIIERVAGDFFNIDLDEEWS